MPRRLVYFPDSVPRLLRAACALCGVVLALASQARAQALGDLKGLSLQQLTQVEVTSVSRRSEKLVDAAAAVEVLSGDRILRAGAHTLPDALRLATGLQVSQLDGREWTISARGFATIASNKMEVTQDGRSLYGPLFSGVLWDVQNVMLDDIDRIEVVRGPGAALWGANAVNGVISIVTKPASETQGDHVNALIGTTERQFAVRHGGAAGRSGYYRVFAQATDARGLRLTNGVNAGDDRRILSVGGRWDLRSRDDSATTVQATAYRGLLRQFGFPQSVVQGGFLNARWERPLGDGIELHLLGSFDHSERDIPLTYSEIRNTGNVELETEIQNARHAATIGARARISADRIGNGRALTFNPSRRTIRLFSVYAQDRYTLPDDRWHLIAGSTFEHNTFTGFEFQPTLRLAFSPRDASWRTWVGVSRAVRTPSRIETDVTVPGPAGLTVLAGSPAFAAERLDALEAGWRWSRGQALLVELSAFENRYDHLRSLEPGTGSVLFVNGNLLNAKSNGAELTTTWRPSGWARLIVGARYLDKVLDLDVESRSPNRGQSEGNDARKIVTSQLSLDLPRGLQFDAVLRHVGRLPQPAVRAYTTVDLRLAWRPHRDWELAIAGRNLLAPPHTEAIQSSAPVEQVRPAGTISITWQR
jgi:iron complex outermembrane receptor protein